MPASYSAQDESLFNLADAGYRGYNGGGCGGGGGGCGGGYRNGGYGGARRVGQGYGAGCAARQGFHGNSDDERAFSNAQACAKQCANDAHSRQYRKNCNDGLKKQNACCKKARADHEYRDCQKNNARARKNLVQCCNNNLDKDRCFEVEKFYRKRWHDRCHNRNNRQAAVNDCAEKCCDLQRLDDCHKVCAQNAANALCHENNGCAVGCSNDAKSCNANKCAANHCAYDRSDEDVNAYNGNINAIGNNCYERDGVVNQGGCGGGNPGYCFGSFYY